VNTTTTRLVQRLVAPNTWETVFEAGTRAEAAEALRAVEADTPGAVFRLATSWTVVRAVRAGRARAR
jgi:hypothetical protein